MDVIKSVGKVIGAKGSVCKLSLSCQYGCIYFTVSYPTWLNLQKCMYIYSLKSVASQILYVSIIVFTTTKEAILKHDLNFKLTLTSGNQVNIEIRVMFILLSLTILIQPI